MHVFPQYRSFWGLKTCTIAGGLGCDIVAMKRKSPADPVRLDNLRRGSYVSMRACARLMKQAKEEGIPEYTSRSSFQRARKKLSSISTSFGALVQDFKLPVTSGEDTIAVQHPMGMLEAAIKQCAPFADLFFEKIGSGRLSSFPLSNHKAFCTLL